MSNNGDPLAQAAIESIRDGMTVGLGTGRAASRGIRALASRVREQNWKVIGVATSRRSAELAQSLGLGIRPMSEVERVDLLFDGVDELDPTLAMTKGGGGAMTHERIVADAADHRIYLMDASKRVERLGERYPLPVETLEFARAFVARRLRELGLACELRFNRDQNAPERTDEGNLILDCSYGVASAGDLHRLSDEIFRIPGVIGHGLFVDQADVILIEPEMNAKSGPIERLERSRSS
ncbi:MAG: ribose-5-phosphate isomerase RpiA [Phycisphaerales bacterium]